MQRHSGLSWALFYLRRPAIASCRLFRSESPRANARNERTTLELGGFSRGNTARRSNDYILHHLSLHISIYFYTRRPARVGRDAATVRHTAISGGDLAGFLCSSSSLLLPSAKQDETFSSWERDAEGTDEREREGGREMGGESERSRRCGGERVKGGNGRVRRRTKESTGGGVDSGVIFIATAPDVQ